MARDEIMAREYFRGKDREEITAFASDILAGLVCRMESGGPILYQYMGTGRDHSDLFFSGCDRQL